MALEHIRILSVLVLGSAVTALLSGDFDIVFFCLLAGSTVPLMWDIDLARIRDHALWRLYGIGTLGLVFVLFMLKFPIKPTVFLLVLFCIVYELYGEHRPKAPARLLSLLSFLVVLYQARIESGLNLMFGLVVYLFSIVWVLYAFHAAQVHGYRFRRLVKLGAWPALRITGGVLVLGLAFFWMLPRLPGQTLGAIPSLGGSRLSGFGERVALNDIRSLKQSRKHVMDLRPLDGMLHSRYLKGKVLDHYDRGFWSSSVYAVFYPLPGEEQDYLLRDSKAPTYTYSVDLEAMHGNTLFFMDNLLQIKGVPQPLKLVGGSDHLSVVRSFPLAMSYTFSAADEPPDKARNVADSIYLDMPRDLKADLRALGDRIAPADAAPEEKVRAYTAWFSRNFTYSLEINNQGKGDPVRYFLFDKRAGHCELFASGLVLMLRAQRIHARLVTGFYIPEPHPSGFYYITESDAHAWVEVLRDGHWYTYDPTPPSAATAPGFAEVQLAYLKHFWRSKVMAWDFDRQQAGFAAARSAMGRWTDRVRRLGPALPVVLLILGLAVVYVRRITTDREPRLLRTYRRLDRLLQKRYGARPARQGVLAYAAALPLSAPAAEALRGFLHGYHRYRFAPDKGGEDARLLARRCRTLIQRLKQEAPSAVR